MPKILVGIGLGAVAGVIDVIPMIMRGLTWDANISAFSLWVVSGFLIAASELKINNALKGIIISFLVLLPAAILVGWEEPVSLVPMGAMTLVLGGLLGYFIGRFGL